MNRPELPPILDAKEYKSLVEKYKEENDKRVVFVKITVEGEKIRQEIDNKINDFGLDINNTINPEDRNDIREALTTLHWILSKKLLRTK